VFGNTQNSFVIGLTVNLALSQRPSLVNCLFQVAFYRSDQSQDFGINLNLHNCLPCRLCARAFLGSLPKKTDVVLTGRYAPKKLIDKADFVNEVKDLKHPEELVTTEGIQY
jgi:hypothetical protein